MNSHLKFQGIHVAAHVVNVHSFYDNFHDEFKDVNPFPQRPKVKLCLYLCFIKAGRTCI